MRDKLIFLYIVLLIVIINVTLLSFYHYKIKDFMNKGARFTSSDGQSLCVRIQKLEKFHQAELPCNYDKQ